MVSICIYPSPSKQVGYPAGKLVMADTPPPNRGSIVDKPRGPELTQPTNKYTQYIMIRGHHES
ncbi:predicted protein [Plenodomus lingam JN3]|uniref:Predicted protein n=1 Tax=Leptosphaeria maculans (strain JN3 / isolate v23.1.3 / race Av1-4-5-6-7-8) TaxID=985895 RepID=E4ZUQ6_LEPMJ|nr:predicted protein [Plenodomus lingam JN3]CBX95135.1 predicted protein [Plenodomus lingam JN3]